jgi:hypothetical protein
VDIAQLLRFWRVIVHPSSTGHDMVMDGGGILGGIQLNDGIRLGASLYGKIKETVERLKH